MSRESPLLVFERRLSEHVDRAVDLFLEERPEYRSQVDGLQVSSPAENALSTPGWTTIMWSSPAAARWSPDKAVYELWIDCMGEIHRGLGEQLELEWRDYCEETSSRLASPGLSFAHGLLIVREWLTAAGKYRRAIGGDDEASAALSAIRDGDGVAAAVMVQLQRIANHFDPPPPDLVGTKYVADILGVTTQRVGQLIREGEIPPNCIVKGTGNGTRWKLYREKIDAWIESR